MDCICATRITIDMTGVSLNTCSKAVRFAYPGFRRPERPVLDHLSECHLYLTLDLWSFVQRHQHILTVSPWFEYSDRPLCPHNPNRSEGSLLGTVSTAALLAEYGKPEDTIYRLETVGKEMFTVPHEDT